MVRIESEVFVGVGRFTIDTCLQVPLFPSVHIAILSRSRVTLSTLFYVYFLSRSYRSTDWRFCGMGTGRKCMPTDISIPYIYF